MATTTCVFLAPTSNSARTVLKEWFGDRGMHITEDPKDKNLAFHWSSARDVDWGFHLAMNEEQMLQENRCIPLVSNYYLKTGLVRKAEMHRLAVRYKKKTKSIGLLDFLPETFVLDLDDDDDDETLNTADILSKLEKNGLWMLKGSESNRGDSIFIFDPKQENLQAWVEQKISTSNERCWLIQRYVDRPLLIQQRKFHLRAHVLAVGDLKVYLHPTASIALIASSPFSLDNTQDRLSHITNHCVQVRESGGVAVESSSLSLQQLCDSLGLDFGCIMEKMRVIVSHLFDAVGQVRSSFFPVPWCFELFGLDLMLDEDLNMWLLEVNSDPSMAVFDDHPEEREKLLHDMLKLLVLQDHSFWTPIVDKPSTKFSSQQSRTALSRLLRLSAAIQNEITKEQDKGERRIFVGKSVPLRDRALLPAFKGRLCENNADLNVVLEWSTFREMNWASVLAGERVGSHIFVRNGLIRPLDLWKVLAVAGLEHLCLTCVSKPSNAGEEWKIAARNLVNNGQRGAWVLGSKQGVLQVCSSDRVLEYIEDQDVDQGRCLLQYWPYFGTVMVMVTAYVLVLGRLRVFLHAGRVDVTDFRGFVLDKAQQVTINREKLAEIIPKIISTAMTQPKTFLPTQNTFDLFMFQFAATKDNDSLQLYRVLPIESYLQQQQQEEDEEKLLALSCAIVTEDVAKWISLWIDDHEKNCHSNDRLQEITCL